jgi:hypothetical protein
MFIAMPFGLMLLFGLFDDDLHARILIALADLALLSLFILTFKTKTSWSLLIEFIAYFLLLSPLIRVLIIVPFDLFNHPSFIFPFSSFFLLYPLSVFFSFREYRQVGKAVSE